MKWEEAIKLFNIPLMYQDASFQNANGQWLPESIIELGERWLKRPQKPSLFLTGGTGSGKTYFSICLLRRIVEAGNMWQIFMKSDRMDRELQQAIMDGQESYVLEKYNGCPFLFIDDLGAQRETERVIIQYCSIIDDRTGNDRPTIISSNLSRDDIRDPSKSNLGSRIASRLEFFYEIVFPPADIRKRVKLHDL